MSLAVVALALSLESQHVENVIDSWKLSNAEARQLRWAVDVRDNHGFERPLMAFKHDIVAGRATIDWVRDFLTTAQRWSDLHQVNEWDVPVFPVTGQDLIDRGVKPGPEMGRILTRMKGDWMLDDFETDRDFYLANIDEFRDDNE